MAETRFTPGPWWLEEDCDELVIVGPRNNCIRNGEKPAWEMCKIDNSCMWDEAKTEFEDRANACLIAAAPDLYAALEDLLSAVCEMRGIDLDVIYEGRDGALSKAKTALAKARGEANGQP